MIHLLSYIYQQTGSMMKHWTTGMWVVLDAGVNASNMFKTVTGFRVHNMSCMVSDTRLLCWSAALNSPRRCGSC